MGLFFDRSTVLFPCRAAPRAPPLFLSLSLSLRSFFQSFFFCGLLSSLRSSRFVYIKSLMDCRRRTDRRTGLSGRSERPISLLLLLLVLAVVFLHVAAIIFRSERKRKRERERERERGKTQIHMRGFVSLPNGPMSNQVGFDRKSQKLKKRDSCLTRVNMTLGRTFERQIVSSSALSCSKKLDVFKNIQKLNERKSSSVHCWLTSIRSDTFFLFVNGEK